MLHPNNNNNPNMGCANPAKAVCLKEKERQTLGLVELGLKIDFTEIITTAWVILDEDLIGQIFIGRKELSLRAVVPATGVRSAVIDNNVTMTVEVRGAHEGLEWI